MSLTSIVGDVAPSFILCKCHGNESAELGVRTRLECLAWFIKAVFYYEKSDTSIDTRFGTLQMHFYCAFICT